MLTYALVVLVMLNGQVHSEILDYGMSLEDCLLVQSMTDHVTVRTEADFAPLLCVAELEA